MAGSTVLEVKEWEEGLDQKNLSRMYKTSKEYQDPRVKRYRNYRNQRGNHYFYKHESKYVKRNTNRKFRRKFKLLKEYDDYLTPISHEYKTYGWITW